MNLKKFTDEELEALAQIIKNDEVKEVLDEIKVREKSKTKEDYLSPLVGKTFTHTYEDGETNSLSRIEILDYCPEKQREFTINYHREEKTKTENGTYTSTVDEYGIKRHYDYLSDVYNFPSDEWVEETDEWVEETEETKTCTCKCCKGECCHCKKETEETKPVNEEKLELDEQKLRKEFDKQMEEFGSLLQDFGRLFRLI